MQWIGRVLGTSLLVGILAYLPRGLSDDLVPADTERVEHDRDELLEANRRLKGEILLLRDEVGALKRDPHEIERIAREDLNLARPDEVVFEVEHVEAAR